MIRPAAILAATAFALALPGTALANNGGAGHAQHGVAGHGKAHQGNAAPPKKARARACPPGLARQNPGCLPPGQWRKGDRLPDSWIAHYIAYAALPDFYRTRHPARPGYRYLYRDNRVFVIDATTRVVIDVILR